MQHFPTIPLLPPGFKLHLNRLALIIIGINFFGHAMAEDRETRQEIANHWKNKDYQQVLLKARKLLDTQNDSNSGQDLQWAVKAQAALGNYAAAETIIREQLATKADNWRVWHGAALALENLQVRWGIIDQGAFRRGITGADDVWSGERDRNEEIIWFLEAWKRGGAQAPAPERATLAEDLSKAVRRRDYGWMTRITPLDKPAELTPSTPKVQPDFDSINQAILLPATLDAARNDGELFRWAIHQAALARQRPQHEYQAALGEAIMEHYGLPRGHAIDWNTPDTPIEQTLRQLSDLELFANERVYQINPANAFIPLIQSAASSTLRGDLSAERARQLIARFRNSRLQFDRLASDIKGWLKTIPRELVDDIDQDDNPNATLSPRMRWIEELDSLINERLEVPQIDQVYPLGRQPELVPLVKNATDLFVSAQPINLRGLTRRMESYLRSQASELSPDSLNLNYSIARLVHGEWADLVGEEKFRHRYIVRQSKWHRPMPRPVRLPLNQGGPWLINYQLPGGDNYFQIVWIAELAAIIHHSSGKNSLSLFDARTGAPVIGLKATMLGWKIRPGDQRTLVSKFRRRSMNSSSIILSNDSLPNDFNWMIWVEDTRGRACFIPDLTDYRPAAAPLPKITPKSHLIPSQSTFAPNDTVAGALWVAAGDHALPPTADSPFKETKVTFQLNQPNGKSVANLQASLDEFGIAEFNFPAPKDEWLEGKYQILWQTEDLRLNQADSSSKKAANSPPIKGSQNLLITAALEQDATAELTPAPSVNTPLTTQTTDQSEFTPSLKLSANFGIVGQPLQLTFAYQQQAEAIEDLEITLERQFENGYDTVNSWSFDTLDDSSDIPLASLNFTVKTAGNYRLQAKYRQADIEYSIEKEILIVDSKGGGARLISTHPRDLVKLWIEREPQLGDKSVRILALSRWPEQFFTLYLGNAVSGYQTQTLKTLNHGALISIDLDPDWAPNAQALALAVRQALIGRDELAINLPVASRRMSLNLLSSTLRPDDSSDQLAPEFTLQVVDPENQPTQCRVLASVRITDSLAPLPMEPSQQKLGNVWNWQNPRWWSLSHSLTSHSNRHSAEDNALHQPHSSLPSSNQLDQLPYPNAPDALPLPLAQPNQYLEWFQHITPDQQGQFTLKLKSLPDQTSHANQRLYLDLWAFGKGSSFGNFHFSLPLTHQP